MEINLKKNVFYIYIYIYIYIYMYVCIYLNNFAIHLKLTLIN